MSDIIPGYNREYLTKTAGASVDLSSFADAGRAALLGLIGAVAVAGVATGKIYQKATEPTDVDFSNAQRAYDVGAYMASIRRQASRLQDEKNRRDIGTSKSMRMM
jgi:hypothetical protein